MFVQAPPVSRRARANLAWNVGARLELARCFRLVHERVGIDLTQVCREKKKN
jgi:hypothetical protein